MGGLNLCKEIVVALCGLIFMITPLSSAFAAQKSVAVPFDQSGCQVILLANKDYLPALIRAIDEAQSEIFVSIFSFKAGANKNSYPDRILRHLAKAVKRGVNVKVILETNGRINDELNTQNRLTGKLLEEQGVKVYFDSPRTTTHTKMIVIDEQVLILGSHNFTQSALKYNNEISIMLSSPVLAKGARNYMLEIVGGTK